MERVVEVEVPVTVVTEVDVEMLPKGSSWAKALTQLAEQLDRGLVYDRTATWQTSRSHWKQPPKR